MESSAAKLLSDSFPAKAGLESSAAWPLSDSSIFTKDYF